MESTKDFRDFDQKRLSHREEVKTYKTRRYETTLLAFENAHVVVGYSSGIVSVRRQ